MNKRVVVAAALGGALTVSGCQSAMSMPNSSAAPPSPSSAKVADLRFTSHGFEAMTYNTIGATVLYRNRYQVDERPDKKSPPPFGPDYQRVWGGSGEVGIHGLPGPALVKWKSLDGTPHTAEVPIQDIFADGKVRHLVRDDEVVDTARTQDNAPMIILEVNDRTINVFMKAHVGTKHEQIPGNKFSTFRDDLIKVWTRTY